MRILNILYRRIVAVSTSTKENMNVCLHLKKVLHFKVTFDSCYMNGNAQARNGATLLDGSFGEKSSLRYARSPQTSDDRASATPRNATGTLTV